LSIGILKDHVGVFIRALEQVTDTVVLANPKVLGLNKQKAQVIVGRRDGFITTTVTETQAIQSVEFLETGTQLIFRPFIGNDGFVRMELHPEDSIGGLTAANLPFEQTTEVTTNVMVKDGQTILIGGLFREVTTDSQAQVPLLGDIPVIGTAFQSRSDSTRRQEVIILLTVHIIKDMDAYAEQSRDRLEDIERLRVGLRQGQMWHGRERLAQALYKTALDQYAAGELDDALWNVRLSLYNNPRLLPAIRLQEELRGRREWDEDGTATKDFIRHAIMRERGISEPAYGKPDFPELRHDTLLGPAGFDDQDPAMEGEHVQ
jgi:type IV pilus assembly protein PilQ